MMIKMKYVCVDRYTIYDELYRYVVLITYQTHGLAAVLLGWNGIHLCQPVALCKVRIDRSDVPGLPFPRLETNVPKDTRRL
jgi:hypothetical protein